MVDLSCNPELGAHLKSPSQKARVISEAWFSEWGYCLNCSSDRLSPTMAGTAARDYICPQCALPYELKASAKAYTRTVNDGGYASMMRRISANEAPTLVLMHRSPTWVVRSLTAIHPVFITPTVVMKRRTAHTRPLSGAKYQMCNLNLEIIPSDGKIAVVSEGRVLPYDATRRNFRASLRFAGIPLRKRGWAALVLSVLRNLNKTEFALAEVYKYEMEMHAVYPENSHIREKIRQQLQVLRDLGYLEFTSNHGQYRLLS